MFSKQKLNKKKTTFFFFFFLNIKLYYIQNKMILKTPTLTITTHTADANTDMDEAGT